MKEEFRLEYFNAKLTVKHCAHVICIHTYLEHRRDPLNIRTTCFQCPSKEQYNPKQKKISPYLFTLMPMERLVRCCMSAASQQNSIAAFS